MQLSLQEITTCFIEQYPNEKTLIQFTLHTMEAIKKLPLQHPQEYQKDVYITMLTLLLLLMTMR